MRTCPAPHALTPAQAQIALSRLRRWLAGWQTQQLESVSVDPGMSPILRHAAATELERRNLPMT